jgi:serine/threonine protein kinase
MITTSQLPAIIASRYVPIRLIAQGGMGAVYEVEHARTGERLALKVLLSSVGASAEALERFKREARASARIKSEHVVRVTDADVAPDGTPFLVMDLLEGVDLERAAAAAAVLEPGTVVEWLRQAARAIDKAHSLGIVHRDLKPENLFLATAADGRPLIKVLDFGIAKMVEDGTGVTGAEQVLGTPKYMAPEQAVANARITPATDRYSLGLIAYRLLLGQSYHHGNAMSILGQLLHGELQLPSNRSPRFGGRFDAWFCKACDRNPEKRFVSASEQIEALAEALGLPTGSLEAERDTGSLRNGNARRTLLAAVMVIAVVAAGLFVFSRPRPGKRDQAASSSVPHALLPVALPPTFVPVVASQPASAEQPTSNRVSTKLGSSSRRAPTSRPSAAAKKPRAPDPLADQK